MNKLLITTISIIFFCLGTHAQNKNRPDDFNVSSDKFDFHINFWVNLHHFLYQESQLQLKHDSSIIDSTISDSFTDSEYKILRNAIVFYQNEIINKHFFYSEFMTQTINYLKPQETFKLTTPRDSMKPLAKVITDFSIVYKKYFWKTHFEQNMSILNQNLGLIRKLETQISEDLSDKFKASWQNEKIRVDISAHGTMTRNSRKNIPYSSLKPSWILMTSSDYLMEYEGLWIELLFHEASHHLVPHNEGFVSDVIAQVSKKLNIEAPRGLWHAYLFYITGKTFESTLVSYNNPNYQMYMEKFNVFATIYPALRNLDKYISKKISLAEATKLVLENINE